MTIHIQEIALSKLIPSTANVRRTGRGERIDELAASIAAHGLLQNLTVRPAAKDRFEVIAGGRRLDAFKLLAKRKAWAKNAPIPCQIIEDANVTEISLAENAMQCPMHPADQFEAFAELHRQDMSIEDIAARFGVSPKIVSQRLKLGTVSPELMAVYRAGDMNLEQLSAFAITDNHALQERVWQGLGYDDSRTAILRALNEGQVSSNDRRARYVGIETYVAAGGSILRDLFVEDGGGFLTDAALLNRLVAEKLAVEAAAVSAEGWNWVATEPVFDYAQTSGMRRIYPLVRELTEAEEAEIETLTARYNTLCDATEDEESAESVEAQLTDIDRQIETPRGDEVYAAEDKAVAGAFVSLGHNGTVRIERGFIKREDDHRGGATREAGADEKPPKAKDDLSAALVAELTAHRTAALANEPVQQPGLAMTAVVHALAAQIFYPHDRDVSCLGIEARNVRLAAHAKEIGESRAMTAIEARHAAWERRMPEDAAGLWAFVFDLTEAERLGLLAHCASLTLDAVQAPKQGGVTVSRENGNAIADVLQLDMAAYWQPTVDRYFGRVSKVKILEAVREGASPETAQALKDLKKPAMADRAKKLLAGKGWLPEVLRTTAA